MSRNDKLFIQLRDDAMDEAFGYNYNGGNHDKDSESVRQVRQRRDTAKLALDIFIRKLKELEI